VSDRYDHLEESEREWLRASRRSAARRSWLLIGVLVVVAIVLAWLTVDGLPGSGGSSTTTTTPEQRVIADGEDALADWGRFAVTNDLRAVKDSFWVDGPQYKQLVKEAQARRGKAPGPPAYQMTMSDVQVLQPREDQRVLRGRVQMTRPGEEAQTFDWDIWLRADPTAGGRWRLWTVRNTGGG
jgi:hypothetical protein